MRVIGFILCAVFLSSCALKTLKNGLPYLVGQPIEVAVNVLGLPNAKMEISEYTIYVWSNQYSTTIPITRANTSYTTGYVGTMPVYGSTTSYNTDYMPINNQCRIKLAVSSSGIIQHWEYFGNEGGCQYYANAIKRIIPE